MTNDRTSPFPLCASSFVLGTMNPAASEPALSEVEGTEARKRNVFAKTTILYACRQILVCPDHRTPDPQNPWSTGPLAGQTA